MAEDGVNLRELRAILDASSVPVSVAACRTCRDPCDEGHESFSKQLDIDMVSQLYGTVKPYNRQVVISTGKSDWEKEVTEAQGTLAAYLLEAQTKAVEAQKLKGSENDTPLVSQTNPGIFLSSQSTRVAILNGSHATVCDEPTRETVLVFPDYKVVTEVPRSLDGANHLWNLVDPAVGRTGANAEHASLRTWILPYSCVIMLCSHKKRDARCSIAAPKLESVFAQSLEAKGWDVHTQLEDPSYSMGSPIEDFQGTHGDKEAHIQDQLRRLQSLHKALIIRNSHIGGHKFAGNCIVYTPQGSSVWYGRVTPHEVESIVQNTVIEGKVLPSLLRGGLNLSRPGSHSLHDW